MSTLSRCVFLSVDSSPAQKVSRARHDFARLQDLYSGLLGPLVICRKGTLRGDGSDRRRADVEKEFALLFMVHDENQSWYLEDNIRKYLNVTHGSATFDKGFHESNLMHGETTQRDSEHDSRFETERELKRMKHRRGPADIS